MVDNFNDVVQFFELFDGLLDHASVSVDHNRHARHANVFGGADRQALDVVAAPPKQRGNARQDAGFVVDQNAQQLVAGRFLLAHRLTALA